MSLFFDIEFISDKFLYSVLSPKAQPQTVCIRFDCRLEVVKWTAHPLVNYKFSRIQNQLRFGFETKSKAVAQFFNGLSDSFEFPVNSL